MPDDEFLVLSDGCILRRLESPVIYNTHRDQMYEVDEEALKFLESCDGSLKLSRVPGEARELVEYALEEGILETRWQARRREVRVTQPPFLPSLRYLLVHITDRCNLRCKHCYLAGGSERELSLSEFEGLVAEFEAMGGLKLMVSGGEPLLHSRFREMLDVLRPCQVRVVLLSNGTLLDRETVGLLEGVVDEVQVSLDGMREGHDRLRGNTAFQRAVEGIKTLREAGIQVSISTMVTSYNTGEFEALKQLLEDLDVTQWGVDVPCRAGGLTEYLPELETASRILSSYGFGGGVHESTGDYTCGSHLCAVMPDGNICKCGFFADRPVGSLEEGLETGWQRVCGEYLWRLDELEECRDCRILEECRGGCRYRALQHKGILSPDPVMCLANGIPLPPSS